MSTTTEESTGIDNTKLEEFKQEFRGDIVGAGDPDYDEVRKIYNGMIDKRPLLFARCRNVADVISAVNFARDQQLTVSIRSGGHNGAGLSLVDNGLVIDLSLMKGIFIDHKEKTVHVESGCTLGDVDHATQPFGLAVPSGIISTTGIGGITLGGGMGYLTRKHGLSIDNLLEANLVLADGNYVKADKNENPDLFWAIRGGGGNFGVVTSFKFQLKEAGVNYSGPMFWPIEKTEEAMKFYHQTMSEASDDLYGFFAFLIVPPSEPFPEDLQGKNVCGVVWNYTGPMEKAEEVFKPIREFGPPILDFVSPHPHKVLQSLFDVFYPPGLQWYWKADFFRELSDEAIKKHAKHGSELPTGHSTMHLYPIDGAAGRVGKEETAWNFRDAKYTQVMVGVDPDPANKNKIINWCQNYWEDLHPHSAGGAYVNFMMEEGEDRVKATYGDHYNKLAEIKGKYDPDNFFRINQNIKPAN